jgi:DNA-binding transcriptional LysR family regulator
MDCLRTFVAIRAWDIVYTSPSLSGFKAAVQAGLGVTARTPLLLSSGIKALPVSSGLPKLPEIEFGLYQGAELSAAASPLKEQVVKVIGGR